MATLVEQINNLAAALGADIKSDRIKIGDLTSLSTTAKTSLVAAINELAGAVGGSGAVINDAVGDGNTTFTWSANKIFDTIEAAKIAVKNDLTAGAVTALDTLNELAAALDNNPTFAATVATDLSNRVRFDAAQTLTAGQKTQACTNIGIGEPDTNFVTAYNTAKA